MKKVYWQLIALAALIVVGFVLVRYYPSFIQKGSSDTNGVITPTDDVLPTNDAASEGAYVVYQTTRVIDRGPEDWANDDVRQTDIYARQVGTNESRLVASIKMDETFDGSPWAEVVGQQVLVHRYSAEEDALIDLDGIVHSFARNSVNRITSRDGSVFANYSIEYGNRAATVEMQVYSAAPTADAPLADTVIDPAELGITLGYAMPFLVSDDGETVYLRQVFEGEACDLDGLWAYDVATDKLTKVSYVMEKNIREYQIDPSSNMLIGVNYAHGEVSEQNPFCGEVVAPSAVHTVNLRTGEGKVIFEHQGFVFGAPFLSPDSAWYAHDYRDDVVRVRAVGASRANADAKVSGHVINWMDNTLVVNRDGEIILYDLETDTVTSIARSIGGSYADPDQVRVEYVGTIER